MSVYRFDVGESIIATDTRNYCTLV